MRTPLVRTVLYAGIYLLLLGIGWLDFITGPAATFM